jgi:hypothetical protein
MPDIFKEAIVTPLLKKNLDKELLASYRPVSNLPFLSKTIERVVAKQLTDHLEKHHIFDPQQSAYRQFHSCESSLLAISDSILSSMDKKEVTLLILLDLTAAFDCVDHQILSQPLTACGIRDSAHQWLMSFLSNRHQKVSVNGKLSSSLPLKIGVPQGSVLGPLLFTLYLSGLRDVIASFNVKYVLYADDIQLYISCPINELPLALTRLHNCIKAVIQWLQSSLLTVNQSKFQFMILGSPAIIKKVPRSDLTVDGVKIPANTVVRDLGIWLDPSLTFTNHVSKVRSKSFMALRIVNRLRKHLNKSLYHMLLHSLVISNIDFGSSLLYGISKKESQRLQNILNSCFRCLHKTGRLTNISEHLKSHRWLSIDQRIHLRLALIMFNIIHHGKPQYLAALINERRIAGDFTLRSSSQNLLQVQFCKTTTASRAFRICGPMVWNSLPLSVREITQVHLFRNAVIDHLLV